MAEQLEFCRGGGCAAKLGPDILERVLSRLPRTKQDPALLVGFENSDDAAVYQLSPDLAFVQTLDFFPPMIEDPYLFGQVAAANAMSDIWAMGGRPVTALNIVCFPQGWDLNILGRMMQGGAEKVAEAGASLTGKTLWYMRLMIRIPSRCFRYLPLHWTVPNSVKWRQ